MTIWLAVRQTLIAEAVAVPLAFFTLLLLKEASERPIVGFVLNMTISPIIATLAMCLLWNN